MRVAVDAMGGDLAPGEIVAGAVAAARRETRLSKLFLVGREHDIRRELNRFARVPACIEIVHASEIVEMSDPPAQAIRRKKDSSISRAVDMVKEGLSDAVFSAGNTGAAVAATKLKLRTLPGVLRPAIATVMPSVTQTPYILIDAGANTDCFPEMLLQFAAMGHVFSREILGIPTPRIGLLSIGGEEAKGNEATKSAFRLFEKSGLQFIGNVEGRDLFSGRADVVVCDGFVGNVVLKTSEGVAQTIGHWLRVEMKRNLLAILGGLLSKPALRRLQQKADPEAYGGAPLLGVNGICIIGHGSSSAQAVDNAVRVGCEWIQHDINQQITEAIRGANGGISNESEK